MLRLAWTGGTIAAMLAALCYVSADGRPVRAPVEAAPTAPIMVGLAGQQPIPVASLDEALAKARTLHAVGQGAVVITLPSGTFRLAAPLALGPADSGLVIRGAADGSTILSGAATIATQPAMGQPLTVDLAGKLGRPASLTGFTFGTLPKTTNPLVFQGDKRIEFAAWPSGGYAKGWTLQPVPGGMLLTYPREPVPKLPDQVLVAGYILADWAYEVVRGVPRPDGIFLPGYQPQFPSKSPPRVRLLNIASMLAPGRMTLDEQGGRLTLSPPADGAPIKLAVAPSVLTISGASNVRIERIRFEKTSGPAVRIERAHAIAIDQCSLGLTGREGMSIQSSTDVAISRCVLRGMGGSGIIVASGDRASLTPGNVTIRDSVIEQYGMDFRAYQPGVLLSGVGNVLDHSLVAVAPHNGVMLSGNDLTVSASEVTGVACETSDVGAIYMGRDWTMRGMRITGNFIHDTGNGPDSQPIGVYLDDQFAGAAISGNVFLRLTWGVLLGGGRDNHVDGNLFALMSGAAIHYDARGLANQRAQAASGGTLMTKLQQSPYRSPAWQSRYPMLAGLADDHPGAPIGNEASDNRLVASPWLKGSDGGFPIGGAPGQPASLSASALSGSIASQYAALAKVIGAGPIGPRGPLLFDRYRLVSPTCSAAGP